MKRFESFDDYKNDMIERSNLMEKATHGLPPSEAIPLICTAIDFYCASIGFNGESTAEFYKRIEIMGRTMNS